MLWIDWLAFVYLYNMTKLENEDWGLRHCPRRTTATFEDASSPLEMIALIFYKMGHERIRELLEEGERKVLVFLVWMKPSVTIDIIDYDSIDTMKEICESYYPTENDRFMSRRALRSIVRQCIVEETCTSPSQEPFFIVSMHCVDNAMFNATVKIPIMGLCPIAPPGLAALDLPVELYSQRHV